MEAAGASSGARTLLKLPPGYHFAPTDEELIVHYLRRRINGFQPLLPIFKDVASLDSQRPEEVTAKFKDCGVDRWFFFTKRRRKYARGNRPNRMTSGNGFWKATGPQRMIRSGRGQGRRLVGRVRTLVFYSAPPTKEPAEEREKKDMDGKAAALSEWKTSWTMYEYENLTSEEEAADKNVDKLGEWVLCTIQKQKEKNDDGPAAAKKVKEEVVKMEPKIEAGGKKRKGKMEPPEDGADHQGPIFHPKPKKRSKVVPTMPPPHSHPAMASPEEGDEMMGMFVFENTGCPAGMSSPVPTAHQHHESPPPCSQTMSPPCVTDNHHYGPGGMVCLPEPPRSAMMSGGNYNIGSSGQIMMPTHFAGNTHNFHTSVVPTPPLQQEAPPHMMSSLSGYINHNVAPFMNNYLHHPHSAVAAHPGVYGYGYGGAAHNTAGQLGDYRYTGVDFPSFLGTSNSGISYADPSPAAWMNRGAVSSQSHGAYLAQSSSQMYHGGPSVPGPGTAMRPAAPLPWKDQVTART